MKKIMYILMMLLLSSFAMASTITRDSTVTRDIAKDKIMVGETVDVNLNVEIRNEETYYLIMEQVPNGWIVISSDGDHTTNPKYIFWVVLFGATDTTHHYTLKTPNTTGTYNFYGTYGFEGGTETLITGDNIINVIEEAKCETDADLDDDGKISRREFRRYFRRYMRREVSRQSLIKVWRLYRKGEGC